jgi:hypothetical protein
MAAQPQSTDFTRDTLGRFVCNDLNEAIASTLGGASPFHYIIIGGGVFGGTLASFLFGLDRSSDQTTTRSLAIIAAFWFSRRDHFYSRSIHRTWRSVYLNRPRVRLQIYVRGFLPGSSRLRETRFGGSLGTPIKSSSVRLTMSAARGCSGEAGLRAF